MKKDLSNIKVCKICGEKYQSWNGDIEGICADCLEEENTITISKETFDAIKRRIPCIALEYKETLDMLEDETKKYKINYSENYKKIFDELIKIIVTDPTVIKGLPE